MLELEDKLLILRFNRGDRVVLHRIYDKYKDDLMTLAAAVLLDVGLAEDVVHDVFLSFLGSADKFRLTGSLRGYLATCVVNRARNVNKAGRRRQGPALEDVPDAPCDDAPPEQRGKMPEEYEDPAQYITRFLANGYKELGRSVIDGIEVEGIEVTDPPTDGGKLENSVGRMWVDVQTELPVQIEIEGTADGKAVQFLMEFKWSQAVDPALFDPNIPSDYTPLGQ